MTQSENETDFRAISDAEIQAYMRRAHVIRSQAVKAMFAGAFRSLRKLFVREPKLTRAKV